jgi:hypothetical protein
MPQLYWRAARRFVATIPAVKYLVAILFVVLVTGCGGSKSSSSSSSGSSTTSASGGTLVTDVSHAKVDASGNPVVATVTVKVGGKAGEHLVLHWGLVDAVSGVRASDQEEVAARYTTTRSVETHEVTIKFKRPVPTDYLVHFSLDAPDGSFLSSADSDVFTIS